MTHAYDRMYLDKARIALGRMLDFAIYDYKFSLADFWNMFLASDVSRRFETGDCSVLVGRSGAELVYDVLSQSGIAFEQIAPKYTANRSEEYWTGWALSYYQWKTALSFSEITRRIPIEEIRTMYSPYHEMDIRHFCDKMSELYRKAKKDTNLKIYRRIAGLSQRELAERSDVPLRTIQQYEQRRKDINKAQVDYLFKLSRALSCDIELLLEKV